MPKCGGGVDMFEEIGESMAKDNREVWCHRAQL